MTISDTHRTPRQEAKARAHAIANSGQDAELCRLTFSGHYFAKAAGKPRVYDGKYEVVARYPAKP